MIMWIIGLSGAGKTTLGEMIRHRVRSEGKSIAHLDGDVVRELFGSDLGHTIKDRCENSKRLLRLSRYLDQNKINVVCSVVSLFPEHRQEFRDSSTEYHEVYIRTKLETLKLRDSKGIYKAFYEGKIKDVAGLDIKFPEPQSCDYQFDNDGDMCTLSNHADVLARKF